MARKARNGNRLMDAPKGGSFQSPTTMDQRNGDIVNPPRFIKGFSGQRPGMKQRNDFNVKHVGK